MLKCNAVTIHFLSEAFLSFPVRVGVPRLRPLSTLSDPLLVPVQIDCPCPDRLRRHRTFRAFLCVFVDFEPGVFVARDRP